MKKKALVLYSGGLDSRLAVKLLMEKGFEVEALHFNLPFGCGCCNFLCNFGFTQRNEVKMTLFDCCKGKLLKEYLEVLKQAKHGTGAGVNPCIDCKIFMFKKAKEYADTLKSTSKEGINIIATGEVLGQRPMSQTSKAMKIIDKEIGFKLARPLMDLGIKGRTRKKQMELAEKFGIRYPTPAGGCLLCEKQLVKRFKVLFENDLIDEKSLPLTMIGRHFFIEDCWFVVARDEKECKIIEKSESFIEGRKGKPAVYWKFVKSKKKEKWAKEKALELQKAYSTRKDKKKRVEFEKWKI